MKWFISAEMVELADETKAATKELYKWKELATAVGYIESVEPIKKWKSTIVDNVIEAFYADVPEALSNMRKTYLSTTVRAAEWRKRAVATVVRHYLLVHRTTYVNEYVLSNKIFLDFDAFRVMVQSGMNTEPVFPEGLFNKTVYFDNVEMAKYILDNVPGTKIDEESIMYGENGYTPVMYAINHLCKTMFDFLVSRGARLDDVLLYTTGQTVRERAIGLGWIVA